MFYVAVDLARLNPPPPAARLLENISEVCSKEGGSELLQEDELVAEAQRATETATTRCVQGKSRQLMFLGQEASVKHIFTLRCKTQVSG